MAERDNTRPLPKKDIISPVLENKIKEIIVKNSVPVRSSRSSSGGGGETGPVGPAGTKGDTGDIGLKGDQGIQGLKGDQGNPGTNGTNGTTPVKNVDYFDGLKGDTGTQGIQGNPGNPGSDATVNATNISTVINAATEKTTPVDGDMTELQDSAATFGIKKLSWLNIKATLKTYFDGLYNPKRLFTNLAAPVVSSGTTEKVLIQLAIPAARAISGSAFRAWIMGLSSSTGTLIFKVRAGAGGTITDAVAWTAITSAAQAANKRAGFDILSVVRSATTLYTDGVAYAGSLQLETVIAAAATSAVTISGIWYISLTVICSVGTFTAQVGSIEEIR